MIKWGIRGILAVLVAALALVAWRHFFPNPEEAIRKQLLELSRLVSYSGNEPALSKVSAVRRIVNMCTTDVEISIDVQGFATQTLSGREHLEETARGVRFHLSGLKVEFLDVTPTLTPSRQSAVVSLTAKIQIPSERDFFPQELKVTMKKVNGEWLVRKIETVRTLN